MQRFIFNNIIIVLLFLFANLFAQEEIQFTHFTTEDGLSMNSVVRIMQDKRGFIWLGTQNGLNRYDGYSFKVFLPDQSNENTITSKIINSFYEDNRGDIWIATISGLNRYDWKTDKFYRYLNDPKDPHSLSNNYVYEIIEDKAGTIWVGTLNGLNKYNRETNNFTSFKKVNDRLNPDSLNSVTNIIEDDKNNLWLSTWNGISCFNKNGKVIKQFFAQPANSTKFEFRYASFLFKDKGNNIWVGTNGSGIKKYNPKTGRFKDYLSIPGKTNSLSNGYITNIYQDNLNNIWIGTLYGLNKYHPKSDDFLRIFHEPNKSFSLINNCVFSITHDMAGLIWIATAGGVSRFYDPPNNFQFIQENYKHPQKGLSSSSIISAFVDKDDNIWVSSFGGVDQINASGDLIAHLKHEDDNPNSLSNNFVRSVFVDSKGIVWIGTNNNGLNRYDRVTRKYKLFSYDINNSSSISNNGITTICEDQTGNLWFGTWWGLNRFDRNREKFTRYLHDQGNPNSLKNDFIWVVYADSYGLLWIGTDRGGLSQLDIKTGMFTNFTNDPNNKFLISDNRIYTIFESKDRMMWIGTSDGLNCIDRKTKSIKIYYQKDGLPGNQISGIQEDNDGYIWIATDKGLSKFDRKNKTFINYNKRNGLKSLEFIHNVAGKSNNGTLYFGLSGVMHFNPKNIEDDYLTSPVVFTDLKIYNESVPVTKDGILQESITSSKVIRIPNGNDVITFEFALLDYFDVKRNTFRYKLDGFDVNWNQVGSRNLATYTNLPPGEYTFFVRATNNNGVKNEKETSLRIIIVPAFYQTWWFKVLLGIGAILAAFLIIQERTRKVKKQNKILENHVIERTKDLDKTINELSQEILERKKAEEKVQASLEEKEVLLKEIHHRVKNNLQVISSLLYLQSFSVKDKETQNLFEDSQNRIKSMALIHEKLYRSKNLAEIDFGEYVSSLLEHLARSLDVNGLNVRIITNINNITLSLDNAISCGLIINEVITNAYKYAFPLEWLKQKKNLVDNLIEINVDRLENNKYALTISDNGIGLPQDLDIDTTESLGLKIVKSMVQQIDGSLEIHRNNGTKYTITFID